MYVLFIYIFPYSFIYFLIHLFIISAPNLQKSAVFSCCLRKINTVTMTHPTTTALTNSDTLTPTLRAEAGKGVGVALGVAGGSTSAMMIVTSSDMRRSRTAIWGAGWGIVTWQQEESVFKPVGKQQPWS